MKNKMKDYTLSQLKELRTDWLADARTDGSIENITAIAHAYCKRDLDTVEFYKEHTINRVAPLVWRNDNLTVLYRKIHEPYMDKNWEQVFVTLGGGVGQEMFNGMRVCIYLAGEDEDKSGRRDRDFFVPGKWMDIINAEVDDAERSLIRAKQHSDVVERDKLKKMLLIGQEV